MTVVLIQRQFTSSIPSVCRITALTEGEITDKCGFMLVLNRTQHHTHTYRVRQRNGRL